MVSLGQNRTNYNDLGYDSNTDLGKNLMQIFSHWNIQINMLRIAEEKNPNKCNCPFLFSPRYSISKILIMKYTNQLISKEDIEHSTQNDLK